MGLPQRAMSDFVRNFERYGPKNLASGSSPVKRVQHVNTTNSVLVECASVTESPLECLINNPLQCAYRMSQSAVARTKTVWQTQR